MVDVVMKSATGVANNHRRAEILDQALQLFGSQGYVDTSMSQIAARVGIAKPTLYHYFDGKDTILFEILNGGLTKAMRRSAEPLPPLEELHRVTRNLLEVVRDYKDVTRIFFDLPKGFPEESARVLNERRGAYEAYIVTIFQRLVADGTFRAANFSMMARAFFGACTWASQWYDDDGPWSCEEVADFFFDAATKGFMVRG